MFDDLEEKTVGEVRDEIKTIAKDVARDFNEVFTDVVEQVKDTLEKNRTNINDIIDNLNDFGSALDEEVIEKIVDIVKEKFSKT